jgi:hypothetical protein
LIRNDGDPDDDLVCCSGADDGLGGVVSDADPRL